MAESSEMRVQVHRDEGSYLHLWVLAFQYLNVPRVGQRKKEAGSSALLCKVKPKKRSSDPKVATLM